MLRRVIPVVLCIALAFGWLAYPDRSAHADPSSGVVYYVDSVSGDDDNDGQSAVQAWKTLDRPNATVFQPGDTLLFKAGGIWNGQLRPLGSGADGQPIVIDMYSSGAKPIINGNGTTAASESGAVMLADQEYWEINNLEVTNFSETVKSGRAGILILSNSSIKSHIYVRNTYVHDVNSDKDGSKVTGGIIVLGAGGFHDVLVEDNHVKNVAIEGIRNASGLTKTSTDVIFRNNYIEDVLGDGIVLASMASGGLVEHNVVKNYANTNVGNRNYAGIWVFAADNTVFQYNEAYGGQYGFNDGEGYDIDLYCNNTLFQYNYSHSNRGGFSLFMDTSTNSVFRYNVSVNDGHDTEIFFYGPTTSAEAPEIYNNTIITGQSSNTRIFNSWNGNATMKFYNNLIYGGKNVNFANFPVKGDFANNSVYPASIIAANGPATHPGLITANPRISNPWTEATGIENTDVYKLSANSPLIDAGKAIANNGGVDFFGNALYNGLPDIGAHEYTDDPGPAPEPIPVTSLTLNETQMPMYVGDTYTLTATVLPENVYEKGVTWTSDNPSIVQVSSTGQVKALATGTATITATSDEDPSFTAECEITVSEATGWLTPAADAYVRDGTYGNANYGSDSILYIKNDAAGYKRNAYVKFDTSLLSYNTFDSAKLRLYVAGADGYPQRSVKVYATSDGWAETGITWNNAPARGDLIGEIVVPNGAAGSWIVLDVTDYVLAHKDDGTITFLLANDEPYSPLNRIANIQFGSRESSNGPQLIIDPEPIPALASSITLNKTQLPLIVDETYALTATVLPANAYNKGVTWSSSNPGIVEVSPTGQVKALAAGTATITATSDGNLAITAECEITVAAATGGLTPAADAFVRDGTYGSANYGGDPLLYIKNDAAGYKRNAYVKFDISLLAYNAFSSAKLRLYVDTANGYPQRSVKVYAASSGWTETGITWNNAPSRGDPIGELPVPNEALGSWVVLDVTDYLLAHKDDGFVTFMFTNEVPYSPQNQISNIQFGSRESLNGPQLIIDPEPVPALVASITLNQTQLPLIVDETYALTADVLPANAYNKGVTWSSSNPSIVQVSPTGQVKALAAGTATITATSDENPAIAAECEITVAAATGGVSPTADAFVRDGTYANANYGSGTLLYIKNDASGYKRNAYMKFDLSLLLTTSFSSAKLRLHVDTADGYSQRSVKVYAASSSWTETGIKWNNAPARGELIGELTVPNETLGSWVVLDVTDYLLAHKDDGLITFMFTNEKPYSPSNQISNIQFDSRESLNAPQLFVY